MSETTTNTMEATETRSRVPFSRFDILARVLATCGAFAFAVTYWMPWFTVTGSTTVISNAPSPVYTFQLSPGDIAPLFGDAVWGGSTVLPLLMLPLIWVPLRHPQRYGLGAVGMLGYMFGALATLGSINLPTSVGKLLELSSTLTPDVLFVTHIQRLPGSALGAASTLVASLSFVLGATDLGLAARAARTARTARAISGEVPQRNHLRTRISASGALTLSAVLFLIGIFIMPWATVNCTQTPLFLGQCTGVNYAGATSAGIRAYANVFDPLAARYAIPILLAGGALLVLLGVWGRDLFRRGGMWLVLWLLTATLFAALGDLGAGAIVANPVTYGLPGGRWSGDSGIAVAFLGLLIGWGAALYLGILALRGRRTPQAGMPAQQLR